MESVGNESMESVGNLKTGVFFLGLVNNRSDGGHYSIGSMVCG